MACQYVKRGQSRPLVVSSGAIRLEPSPLANTKGENCLTSWSRDSHDCEFHLDGLSHFIGSFLAWQGSAWSMHEGAGHQS